MVDVSQLVAVVEDKSSGKLRRLDTNELFEKSRIMLLLHEPINLEIGDQYVPGTSNFSNISEIPNEAIGIGVGELARYKNKEFVSGSYFRVR